MSGDNDDYQMIPPCRRQFPCKMYKKMPSRNKKTIAKTFNIFLMFGHFL